MSKSSHKEFWIEQKGREGKKDTKPYASKAVLTSILTVM